MALTLWGIKDGILRGPWSWSQIGSGLLCLTGFHRMNSPRRGLWTRVATTKLETVRTRDPQDGIKISGWNGLALHRGFATKLEDFDLLTEEPGLVRFTGYSQHGFSVLGIQVTGGVLAYQDLWLQWKPSTLEEVTPELPQEDFPVQQASIHRMFSMSFAGQV